MTIEQNGKISLAGPAMNIIIGSICLAILFVLPSDTLLFLIFSIVAYINLWLAIFNLLPIPPLDGSKVFYWNKPIYVASMALAVALFILANII
jgi:Zn-dependent protease